MGPAWFMVQSLFFSRGGLLGVFSVAEDGDHRNNNDDDCDGQRKLIYKSKVIESAFWNDSFWLLDLSRNSFCSYLPWPYQHKIR